MSIRRSNRALRNGIGVSIALVVTLIVAMMYLAYDPCAVSIDCFVW